MSLRVEEEPMTELCDPLIEECQHKRATWFEGLLQCAMAWEIIRRKCQTRCGPSHVNDLRSVSLR